MKKITLLALLIILLYIPKVQFAQFILVPNNDHSVIFQKELSGGNSNSKVYVLNCLQKDRDVSKFLIHFVVYSDSSGVFASKEINKSEFDQKNIRLDSLFSIARNSTRDDQNREISYFEYEGNRSTRTHFYKLVIENSDGSYTLLNNFTYCYFYEIRPFKQFTVVQSCASLINTNSIFQNMKRVIDKEGAKVVEFPELENSLDDYFPHKLFLEKINTDSTFHFIKFRRLCMDCADNDNFEFDYDPDKGIVRFWQYLPKAISRKKRYIKFE